MTLNIENLREIPNILYSERKGNNLIVDGHVFYDVYVLDHGEKKEFVIDNRFSYTGDNEISYLFASAIVTAMAIGAGKNNIREYGREAVELGELYAEVKE